MDEQQRGVSRRTLVGGAAMLGGALAAAPARAQPVSGAELVPIWPGGALTLPTPAPVRKATERSTDPAHPDRWVTGIAEPVLIVRRAPQPEGAAVLLLPGGGYGFLSYDNEGEEQARWLNARGVTAFILLYRLPGEGWARRATVPLADAQRAMRTIRARAADFGIDAGRVAVMGFSAGGHLAGSLATRFDERVTPAIDATDRLSARPDLAALIYPVVSMSAPYTHAGSRDALLGADADGAARTSASVENRVTAQTPPIFLVHAADDGTVPIANSLVLYQQMLGARRPAELHAFDEGGHGFGVRLPKAVPASAWPTLFATYATRKRLLRGG